MLLSIALAVVVWVSAVMASDPNQELALAQPVTLEIVGQDPGLLLMGNTQSQVQLRLNAPKSVWSQLNNSTNAIRAWVDLTAMKAGTYTVPVHVQINTAPGADCSL